MACYEARYYYSQSGAHQFGSLLGGTLWTFSEKLSPSRRLEPVFKMSHYMMEETACVVRWLILTSTETQSKRSNLQLSADMRRIKLWNHPSTQGGFLFDMLPEFAWMPSFIKQYFLQYQLFFKKTFVTKKDFWLKDSKWSQKLFLKIIHVRK